MRAGLWTAAILLAVVTVARTSADANRGRGVEAPRLLSATGLYLPGTLTVDPANRPYSPQYPLWTDGAAKRRWIRLPEGGVIDARDEEDWVLPVGTRLWKEFAFSGRRVETRLIWRARADAWVFASYVWNDAQTDAILAPSTGVRHVAEIGSGRRHSIPSRDDCQSCHEQGNVLGLTALQLSTDRDPLAPHAESFDAGMVSLQSLVDEGRLRGARADLLVRPPRIRAETPVARAALGYLSANCGICHREGAAIDSRLRLRPAADGDVTGVLNTLRTARVAWDMPHAPEGATRFVTPGHPELSSIVARMKSRRPSSQMPPLGTVTPDADALTLVTRWIAEMDR